MSLILESADRSELKVNAWNWDVLHHRVGLAAIFPPDVWEPKRSNGGGDFDAVQVWALADFLEQQLLPELEPGARMFFDGTVTTVPDDGTFYRDPADAWKNYSLQRDVLLKFIAFLRQAKAPLEFL